METSNVPPEVSQEHVQKICDKAIENIKAYGVFRGWQGTSKLIGEVKNSGQFSIKIPKSVHYLKFQNWGTKPYLLWSLEGKKIPMKDTGRVITVRGVGQPGWVDIPLLSYGEFTGKYEKIWREKKWFHPGLRKQMFIEQGIQQACISEKQSLSNIAIDYSADLIKRATKEFVQEEKAKGGVRRLNTGLAEQKIQQYLNTKSI